MPVITTANLMCPECGNEQDTEMPVEACQYFYECVHCEAILTPQPGDCCVYCSYADVKCPPQQREEASSNQAA